MHGINNILNPNYTGIVKQWDEKGQLMMQSEYANGQLNGISLVFINGKLNEKNNYINNLRHGPQYTYGIAGIAGVLLIEYYNNDNYLYDECYMLRDGAFIRAYL